MRPGRVRGTKTLRWALAGVAGGVALAGCAALPLTAATAPLAVLGWGAMIAAVLGDETELALGDAPSALLQAEARQTLSRDDIAQGHLDPAEPPQAGLAAWLSDWGFAPDIIGDGEVLVARIGSKDGERRGTRGVYLPVLRHGVNARPGNVIEIRLGASWPAAATEVRAATLADGRCGDEPVRPDRPKTETFFGKSLGHPQLTATFACTWLRPAGWMRPKLFWFKPEPREQADHTRSR